MQSFLHLQNISASSLRRTAIVPFLLILLLTQSCAQPKPADGSLVLQEAEPATAGFDATGLTRLDSMLKTYVDSGYIGGATALIARDGKMVYYKGIGSENLATKAAMDRDEIFRIASQTKAITCVAIMMLAEQGKLKLTDSVGQYIAEYRNQSVLDKFNAKDTSYTTVPVKRPITIHDLLTHTSGIDYAQIGSPEAVAIYAKNGIPGGLGVYNISMPEKMKLLGTLPLLHQPGTKWTYGLNMDVLGYLVEVISGKPLDQFFREQIFTPLGMKDTWFYLPKDKWGRLVKLSTEDSTGHVLSAGDTSYLNAAFFNDYPASKGDYFSGGGGLSSTALNYAVFLQMLLNDGIYNGVRILKPESVKQMTTDQIPGIDFGDSRFGLGFSLSTKESLKHSPLTPGSYGWGGFFSTSYWVDPAKKIVGLLYVNQFPQTHREIHEKFMQLTYDAMKK